MRCYSSKVICHFVAFYSPAGCAWQTGEFSIDHFSTKQANGHILVSEEYRLEHNQQWSLFVYPVSCIPICFRLSMLSTIQNGFRLQYGLGLSVFLKLISGFEEPIHYRFTIEMLHSSGNSAFNCTRTDTRIFKAGWRNGWTLQSLFSKLYAAYTHLMIRS